MNTRPRLGVLLFSLAFCIASQAGAATLPKWEPADEGWGAWNELMFTDSKGKPHDLWCHYKECGRQAKGVAHLYILKRKGQNEPYGNQAWRTTFSSQLSQFTFDAAKERVIDPRDKKEYAVRYQAQLTAQGSVIKVLPPTSAANDATGEGQAPAAAALKAISFDPASVQGGAASKGWVSLKEAAPAAVAVALASNNPAASLPKTVSIAKGKKLASFSIKTTAVTEKKTVRITAKLGSSAQGANLTILPATTGQKPDVVQKPDEVQKPDQKPEQKPSAADLFSDPVEKAVMRYLLDALPEDQRKKEDEALRAAFAKSPDDPLIKGWQRKVLDKVNEQLTLEDHKPFLEKTGLTDPQLLGYICPKLPAPVVTETKDKALDQAKKMAKDGEEAKVSTDMEDAKSKADFQPSPVVAGLCSKSKGEAALTLPTADTGNIQTDLSRTGNVPSVVVDAKKGAGGDPPKKEPLFNLDEKGKRDATAFGLLSGGIMGFLFMGAGAGPAGIFLGALIGGVVGFLGYAMKKKK
jgi:hypothetical protein